MEKIRSGKSFRKRTAQFELNSLLVNQNILKLKNNVSLVVSSSKSEAQNQGKKKRTYNRFLFLYFIVVVQREIQFWPFVPLSKNGNLLRSSHSFSEINKSNCFTVS